MGATIIVGAQWGDEAKGLISAYTSMKNEARLVCRGGTGSNAEHGLFLRDNKTYVKVNQLPLGWMMNPDTQIRIGSGVAVDPVKLFYEMDKYKVSDRVKIDYRCPIITAEHIEAERTSKAMSSIGSTFSGTGFCRADFVLRKAKQARDFKELEPYIVDLGKEINEIASYDNVTVESSQGALLSLAISQDYPNVTSDNVTTCAVADDVLLSWRNIDDVVLVVKAMPTREGAGSMGLTELTEEEIIRKQMVEISSIEGKIRRKAVGIDFDMLEYVSTICGATKIALTFCDHFDPEMTDCKDSGKITHKVWDLIGEVEKRADAPVTLLNTGKAYDNIIDLEDECSYWDDIRNTVENLI